MERIGRTTCPHVLFFFHLLFLISQNLFDRFRNKVWHLCDIVLYINYYNLQDIYESVYLYLFIARSIDVIFWYFCSFVFCLFGSSEARDSLSDILRGVFKFTSSRQCCGADGYYQFPHLFSVRLQIFLSLHLELGSGAAIFLSWLWALGKCCENDDVLSDVAGEQWASWYECTIMTK